MRFVALSIALVCMMLVTGCAGSPARSMVNAPEYSLCQLAESGAELEGKAVVVTAKLVRGYAWMDNLRDDSCPNMQYVANIIRGKKASGSFPKFDKVLWKGNEHGFIYPNVDIELRVLGRASKAGHFSVFTISKIFNYQISYPGGKPKGPNWPAY